ncbi:MAG: Flp family type IVb pilin [Erysipelotrichaceae bacterium]|nr:Flp family type IVb pilin [Erysipelotrichaceae bacterium]
MLKKFYNDECGQGMVEYGLLVALISVAAIAVIKLLGPKITATFQTAVDAMGD